MPNQKQRQKGGTKIQQKPMPKQDKEGGINPAFDPRALCPLKWRSGAAIWRPATFSSVVRRALVTSGKPAL